MVWIFSNSNSDRTIKAVQEWIFLFSKKSINIVLHQNYIDLIKIIQTKDLVECIIEIEGSAMNLNSIESIWFKGGGVEMKDITQQQKSKKDLVTFKDSFGYYFSAYSIAKLEFILFELSKKRTLGANLLGRFNKINALALAKDAGLNIPQTIVTGSKSELCLFMKTNGTVVCKSLDLNFDYYSSEDETWFHSYTTELTNELFNQFPDKFPLSVFQKKIEKKYEIRTFFLNNKCYSMAIFSQFNAKTTVDYRRYDNEKMNRVVPYRLPNHIEEFISDFMNRAGLKTGSIDIIRSKGKEFIFLEVNPIGQFGYLSGHCNYFLEKQIAKYLVDHED